MNIIVPMAGEGKRFIDAEYEVPKPFIDVNGVSMIQAVYDNLPFEGANWFYMVRKEHTKKYDEWIPPGRRIIVEGTTGGAACTVLLAKEHIDNDEELLIVNSDQLMDYNIDNFNTLRRCASVLDGMIFVFWATEHKWSFAKISDESGLITQVAEKNPISTWATTGVYYWKKGKQFVTCAENMIEHGRSVNGEFYICPVYNELINYGSGIVAPYYVTEMYGLGTPEDLERYIWREDE